MPSLSTPTTELIPGLVSVTFRSLVPDDVIALAESNGLLSIEWGGDIHVPLGDTENARTIGERTRDAGLAVSAYGSYFRVGTQKERAHSFTQIADTTAALQTAMIRVWVGECNSEDAADEEWDAVLAELKSICGEAADRNLNIGMEFHSGTLNNSAEASRRIIETVKAPNLSSFWQTTNGASDAYSLGTLREMRDWISNVHVFNWTIGSRDQTALADGADRWAQFLRELNTHSGTRHLGLEFVKDGTTKQFCEDAATLQEWVK